MMFIDFGANDPNVDISSVQFESVNAIVVKPKVPSPRFVNNMNYVTNRPLQDVAWSPTSILWPTKSNKMFSRYLILRHREYNKDITDLRKIDLQGRSYDPTETHKLGSFSWKLHNKDHFRFSVSGYN